MTLGLTYIVQQSLYTKDVASVYCKWSHTYWINFSVPIGMTDMINSFPLFLSLLWECITFTDFLILIQAIVEIKASSFFVLLIMYQDISNINLPKDLVFGFVDLSVFLFKFSLINAYYFISLFLFEFNFSFCFLASQGERLKTLFFSNIYIHC